MGSAIDVVVHMASGHSLLAMLIVFLAAAIEALVLVGILIPGTPIVMGVAACAAAAKLSMWPFVLMAILGGIMGDWISFWIGLRFGDTLKHAWPLRNHPVLVAKAESFFQNHGIASVALCRFVPFLRGTVPLVAGMAGMSRRRFFIVNVISASVWGPAHVLPAQFAGKTLQHLRQGNWSLALWCGVALVAAGLAAYLGQRWVRLHVARRPPAAPAADLAAPAPTATAA